jgi:glutaredoxin 3
MYATPYCPYCVRARQLLAEKGVDVEEFDVSMNPALRTEMMERSNRWTVPQIFIDGLHVGGSDDLILANRSGELDRLLNGGAATQAGTEPPTPA